MNPGAGTKFNLADCYVHVGRLATALAYYREVENVTREVGQMEQSATAKERADALEPKVPTVLVRAPWLATLPQAAISLDGKALTAAEVEQPIKVDFGKHVAVAKLDDAHQSHAEATIDKEGDVRTLFLASPSEPPRASEPSPVPTADHDRSTGNTQRILAGTSRVSASSRSSWAA